jgi:hypothetical protein
MLLVQGLALGVVVCISVANLPPLVRQLPFDLIRRLAAVSLVNWPSIGANAVVAIFALIVGVALLQLRPWAWIVAMLLEGYSLTLSLWSSWQGYPAYAELLIAVVIVFYLNLREVRRAFEVLQRPADTQHLAPSPAGANERAGASATGSAPVGDAAASSAPGPTQPDLPQAGHLARTSRFAPPELGDDHEVARRQVDDRELLRRFEPVLCFTRGEQFYPMNADDYLAHASLRIQRPDGEEPETLVPRGQLDASSLARWREQIPWAVYFLSVADVAPPEQVRAFRRSSTLREFHPGPGRLVRVGLLARVADVLFSLSLLLRGRAPGGLAVGAALRYQATQPSAGQYWYYGRVVRQHGYVALQYCYFYAFNDWRSSFNGVNDHEGDWELVTVYAAPDATGAMRPCWLACSAHESDGDDLRRRWDDPALARAGEHPIIYVGAGSHANYFFAGEYMPAVEAPFTQAPARAWLAVRRVWARLGQGDIPGPQATGRGFRIPFVDYARGDGLRIGPDQPQTWQMGLLQSTSDMPAPAWVDGYLGLWGLYSGDPLGGEDAPPGPRFDRTGTERTRWYDPVGWCGLDKTPPPAAALATLEQQRQRLRARRDELSCEIEGLATQLAGLGMEAQAQRILTSRRLGAADGAEHEVRQVGAELARLKAERAACEAAEAQCATYAERLVAGDPGDPRAHLRRPVLPVSPATLRLSRLAAVWSAVSIAVLLLGLAVLVWFFPSVLVPGMVLLLGIYAFVEALFHRALDSLLRGVVVALALAASLVLVVQFFGLLLLVLVVGVGIFILVDNLREVIA